MASIRHEYEIEIHPTGEWFVFFVRGEIRTRKASGLNNGENCMERSEADARKWVEAERERERTKQEFEQRVKRITIPA